MHTHTDTHLLSAGVVIVFLVNIKLWGNVIMMAKNINLPSICLIFLTIIFLCVWVCLQAEKEEDDEEGDYDDFSIFHPDKSLFDINLLNNSPSLPR